MDFETSLRSNKKLENFGFLATSKPFSVSIIPLNAVVVATAVMLAVITVRAVIIVAIRHVLFCETRFYYNHCSNCLFTEIISHMESLAAMV